MRGARMLWAEIVQKFNPSNPKSLMLRTHCQTSGWSLLAQDPYNNIARTSIEALAAVFGGTQSLHTNALDEALALPSDFSAKVARDTQLYIQRETDIVRTIDLLGGSHYIEKLTSEIVDEAKSLMKEVEDSGGMVAAIEKGVPKMRIEEAAAKKQAMIDSGEEKIIGLNIYQHKDEEPIELLEIDNALVRNKQIEGLRRLRLNRNQEEFEKSISALITAAKNDGNLLEACVIAARARASLGEISQTLESVFGRFQARSSMVSGVYMKSMSSNSEFQHARELSDRFAQLEGRRPRILVAKIGQDGHDRGAKVISTGFADLGFDVDIGPLFQTPQEVAMQAAENDVHIVGISSLAAGHKTLVPATIQALKEIGRDDIMVIAGGVIPPGDYEFLYQAGVKAVFGPGTTIPKAASELLLKLIETLHPINE